MSQVLTSGKCFVLSFTHSCTLLQNKYPKLACMKLFLWGGGGGREEDNVQVQKLLLLFLWVFSSLICLFITNLSHVVQRLSPKRKTQWWILQSICLAQLITKVKFSGTVVLLWWSHLTMKWVLVTHCSSSEFFFYLQCQ